MEGKTTNKLPAVAFASLLLLMSLSSFSSWSMDSTAQAQEANPASSWWNRAWAIRIPVVLTEEKGHSISPFVMDLWLDMTRYNVLNATRETRVTYLDPATMEETEVPLQVTAQRFNSTKTFEARILFRTMPVAPNSNQTYYVYLENPDATPSVLLTDFNPDIIKNRLANPIYENNNYDLLGPTDLATDSQGRVYVVDRGNHRIQIFSDDGTYLETLGTSRESGSDHLSFLFPTGVGVSGSRIFVADAGNHRIQIFDLNGNYVDTLGETGEPGSALNRLCSPKDVAVGHDGKVYVADAGNHRILVFNDLTDKDADQVIGTTGVSGTGNGFFNMPFSVDVSDSNIYVSDSSNHRVQVFDLNGTWQRTIGQTGILGSSNFQFFYPYGVSVGQDGRTYVADHKNHRIQVFDDQGTYVRTMGVTGSFGSANTRFNNPNGVLACNHRIYVADYDNNRVQVFTMDGGYAWTLGGKTDPMTQTDFSDPRDVKIGPDGRIYIADRRQHRVQVFESDYTYVMTLGTSGEAGAQHTHLSGPYGIDITPNMIAIADSDNNRIQFFDVQGNYLHTLSGAGPVSFVYPCGVKIDETRNRIYVADTYAERVQVFDMERNHIATIRGGDGNYTDNALPTGNLTFKHPYDVNIDSNGMIYVLDTDHQVIQVFDPVTFNHSHSLEGSSWSSFDGFWAGDIRWACGFDMVDDVIYIADTYNHRVKIIDLDGNFLGVVGLNETSGSTNEHFARPRGVGVGNGGMIYVADSDNNRIQVFNPDLSFNTSLSSSGLAVFDNMHFNYPEGVAVDASGNIYVADSNNHRIQAYSSTGNHLFTIGSSTQRASGSDNFHLFNPSSVKIHGNRIYVVDKGNARIQVFSMSGIYERTIGADCYDMAIGPGGNLYVADTPNHCIKVLTSAGQTIQTLGTFMVSGSSNTHLNFPTSVAVDSAGRVYVSDHMNHRIVIYDDISSSIADRIIGDTGIKGSDVNHFDGPKGVAVWSNEIYVADTGNQRVQIFNQAGNYLRTIGVTGKSGRDNVHFRGLVDVFVDVEGTLYVADSDNNRVVKIVNVEGQAFSAEARPLPPSGPSRQGLDPAALPLLLAVPIIIMAGLLLILTRKKPGEHEVEGVSSTPLPAIKTGVTYRVEGENPAKLFSLVDRHLGEGKKAMCISRQSPDSVMDQLSSLAPGKIMDRYEMPMSNIYWISGATSERAIAPGDLNRLLFVVGNFADKNPGSIITMDGIDHISTHVPFEKLIDLVGSLAELAAIKKVSIVILVQPEAYGPRELTLLRQETKKLE